MSSTRLFCKISVALAAVLLASCATKVDPTTLDKKAETYKNPYPAGTYDHFKAEKDYPKTYNVWRNEELLSKTDASNYTIVIDQASGALMAADPTINLTEQVLARMSETNP